MENQERKIISVAKCINLNIECHRYKMREKKKRDGSPLLAHPLPREFHRLVVLDLPEASLAYALQLCLLHKQN